MKFLNHPALAVALFAILMALGAISYPRPMGYTHSVFKVLDSQTNGSITHPKPQSYAKQQAQAAALRDIWHISDAEIAKPINLWGE